MSTKPRASLTSLADRMAKKDPPAAEPVQAAEPVDEQKVPRDGRVQVLVRMKPLERKAIRRIALEHDTTVQALVEEALQDLIRRYNG